MSTFPLVQSLPMFFIQLFSQKAVLQLGRDHSACQCTSGPEVISRWCVGICTSFIYLKLGPGKRVSWDITPPSPGRLGEGKQIIHSKYHLHHSNTFIALLPNPNEGKENAHAIQTFIKWELCSPFKAIYNSIKKLVESYWPIIIFNLKRYQYLEFQHQKIKKILYF